MIQIVEASAKQLDHWDSFIDNSINGTLFHKRKFLNYHGDRFNEHFLVVKNGDTMIGQISYAVKEIEGKKVAHSHFGATYGGFIFDALPTYSRGKEIASEFVKHIQEQKIHKFSVTLPLSICGLHSLDVFTFNLFEQGFRSINRDISTVVFFQDCIPVADQISSRARNMIKKAKSSGLTVKKESTIKEFWKVIDTTFKKHGANPTHNPEELEYLMKQFPHSIYAHVAYYDNRPVAGVASFEMNTLVNSSFYLCQDPEFQNLQGLSFLIATVLEESQTKGFKFYDFGLSTNSMVPRENVFSFKESFSKVGVFRETLEWRING